MSSDQRPGRESGYFVLIPLVFLIVAALLILAPSDFKNPAPAAMTIPEWASDTAPVRDPSLRPEFTTQAATYTCDECHNLFDSPPETERELTQHADIHLNHGNNTRCFNCHHPQYRNSFIDAYGRTIAYGSPEQLCSRCHGLVFRDWQNGVHGRSGGYWLKSAGTQTRLLCTECHDPHHPPFAPMIAAPQPNTIRTGAPLQQSDHANPGNPLHHRVGRTGHE